MDLEEVVENKVWNIEILLQKKNISKEKHQEVDTTMSSTMEIVINIMILQNRGQVKVESMIIIQHAMNDLKEINCEH